MRMEKIFNKFKGSIVIKAIVNENQTKPLLIAHR